MTNRMNARGPMGLWLTGAAAVALIMPGAAFASDATDAPEDVAQQAAAPAPQQADSGGLEDIIVTAQRREENLQKVSIAIQAITQEGLVRSGINDVTRLELVSPGVTFSRYGADAKISIRGANSNNTFLDASPSVGVFVDGVFRPRASQQTRAFFDVSRLEVLKGPQGTLYGRNTLAGAVNLYTNAPDPSKFAAGANLQYARFNTLRTEGFVNVPLSETVAVRVAGLFERGDGWINNIVGEDLGNPDTVSVRGSLRYEAPSGGDLTLRVTNIRERGNVAGLFAMNGVCRSVTAEGLTDPFGSGRDCRNPRRGAAGTIIPRWDQVGRLTVARDFVHEDEIDEFNATLEANLPIGDSLAVKGVFSYTDFHLEVGQDNDFSERPHAWDILREKVKSYTSELQLSNTGQGPFKFTVGGYLSKDEIEFLATTLRYTRDDTSGRPNINVPGFPGTTRPRLDPTPIVSPVLDTGAPVPGRQGQSSNAFQFQDVITIGLFGQTSVELTDGLRLVGGIRYSREEKESVNYSGPTSYQGPQFPTTVPKTLDNFSTNQALATSRTARNFENVTWRASVEYDVNPDVMLFATASTGFLSGTLNQAGATTDEQESTNYEAGVKSTFLNNALRVNASVYHTKYKNLVTSFQRINNAGAIDTISTNGGEIKATGAELLVEARPVDALRLTLGLNYLDAEFGTFGILAPHQLVRGDPTTTGRFINLEGVTPPYSPEFTASFIGAYDFELGDGSRITPQVQFYYSDRFSAHTQLSFLDPAGTQPSFTKTDLRLTWTSADDRYSLEGFVENLENEIVNQRTTYGGDGIEQVVWGYPRNYGVRARLRF